jgi:hypothetical protein
MIYHEILLAQGLVVVVVVDDLRESTMALVGTTTMA